MIYHYTNEYSWNFFCRNLVKDTIFIKICQINLENYKIQLSDYIPYNIFKRLVISKGTTLIIDEKKLKYEIQENKLDEIVNELERESSENFYFNKLVGYEKLNEKDIDVLIEKMKNSSLQLSLSTVHNILVSAVLHLISTTSFKLNEESLYFNLLEILEVMKLFKRETNIEKILEELNYPVIKILYSEFLAQYSKEDTIDLFNLFKKTIIKIKHSYNSPFSFGDPDLHTKTINELQRLFINIDLDFNPIQKNFRLFLKVALTVKGLYTPSDLEFNKINKEINDKFVKKKYIIDEHQLKSEVISTFKKIEKEFLKNFKIKINNNSYEHFIRKNIQILKNINFQKIFDYNFRIQHLKLAFNQLSNKKNFNDKVILNEVINSIDFFEKNITLKNSIYPKLLPLFIKDINSLKNFFEIMLLGELIFLSEKEELEKLNLYFKNSSKNKEKQPQNLNISTRAILTGKDSLGKEKFKKIISYLENKKKISTKKIKNLFVISKTYSYLLENNVENLINYPFLCNKEKLILNLDNYKSYELLDNTPYLYFCILEISTEKIKQFENNKYYLYAPKETDTFILLKYIHSNNNFYFFEGKHDYKIKEFPRKRNVFKDFYKPIFTKV